MAVHRDERVLRSRQAAMNTAMTHAHRLLIAAITAVLLALALLAGFASVLRQSVRQGESRRLAVLRQAEAWSDCGRRERVSARAACRAELAHGDTAASAQGGP